MQTQETLADGNSITNQHQTTVYRDSAGRIRTEETITPRGTGEQPYTIATILDYVGGDRYVLDSKTMTAYQSPLRVPQGQAAAASGPRAGGMGRRGGAQANAAGANPNRPQVVSTALTPKVVNGSDGVRDPAYRDHCGQQDRQRAGHSDLAGDLKVRAS